VARLIRLRRLQFPEKSMIKSSFKIVAIMLAVAFHGSAQAEVTVTDPWVRGVVTGQTATGAFMALKSTEDTKLVSAASPVAKQVEIHEMKMNGEMMTMRPLPALPLPANTAVALDPSGYHVMLIGLTKAMNVGDKVPITLNFEDKNGKKSSMEIKAEVRPLNASSHDHHDHKM
jgi:copper(I)-binding protein